MEKNILWIGLLIVMAACTQAPAINNFLDCANAGSPVMESYPRQCSANGKTFIEELEPAEKESHVCTEEEQSATICTMDYNPVCGMADNGIRCITTPCPSVDAITYANGCGACSAGAILYYQGSCEEQTFVVCNGNTFTGFDPKKYAAEVGGVCVETCPGNFDPYMTQIGIELCILRYDKETIAAWRTCDRSSTDCDCVKAYETTTEEPIERAEYRCVPEDYADRLLFRGGVDRLDEEGERSVVIA